VSCALRTYMLCFMDDNSCASLLSQARKTRGKKRPARPSLIGEPVVIAAVEAGQRWVRFVANETTPSRPARAKTCMVVIWSQVACRVLREALPACIPPGRRPPGAAGRGRA
jgi:hypothetical protein